MNKSFWAGHLLQFETRQEPDYAAITGTRLLLIFFVIEYIFGPRLALAEALGLPILPAAVRIPVFLILALVLIRFIAGIPFSKIGLHPWKQWSATERWYFIQTLILVNVIFATLLLSKVKIVLAQQALWSTALVIFSIQMLWGFYQELIYRGILQTELVRRWGGWIGILISNLLFTFGPLHFYHFTGVAENPSKVWIFAAIFAIGLFFGVLFQRSGNLWIVAVFHGIGDWYITGLQQVVSAN